MNLEEFKRKREMYYLIKCPGDRVDLNNLIDLIYDLQRKVEKLEGQVAVENKGSNHHGNKQVANPITEPTAKTKSTIP